MPTGSCGVCPSDVPTADRNMMESMPQEDHSRTRVFAQRVRQPPEADSTFVAVDSLFVKRLGRIMREV